MRITGYCEVCHRVRTVTVRGEGLVRLVAGGVATGTCSQCEEKERNERSKRRQAP